MYKIKYVTNKKYSNSSF